MYIPKIGDSVYAKRKIKSKIYSNLVIGPIVDVWDNACRMLINKDTENERDCRLYFNEWEFTYLFPTEDETLVQQSLSGSEAKASTPKSCSNCLHYYDCLETGFDCKDTKEEWEPA